MVRFKVYSALAVAVLGVILLVHVHSKEGLQHFHDGDVAVPTRRLIGDDAGLHPNPWALWLPRISWWVATVFFAGFLLCDVSSKSLWPVDLSPRSRSRDSDSEGALLRNELGDVCKHAGLALWCWMPLVLSFASSFSSSCTNGAPTWVYAIYALFVVVHVACVVTVHKAYHQGVPKLTTAKLFLLSMLEHSDMAFDAMATGQVSACDQAIGALWLRSWQQAAPPAFASPLEKAGLGGLAVTIFWGCAVFPQAARMHITMALPFSVVVTILSLVLMALTASLTGLGGFMGWVGVVIVVPLWFACFYGGFLMSHALLVELCVPLDWASWACIYTVEPEQPSDSANELAKTLLMLGRLLCENALQLWLQVTVFSWSMRIQTYVGMGKSLASIIISLLASITKLYNTSMTVWDANLRPAESVTALVAIIFAWFALLWVPAKLVGDAVCYPVPWNSMLGCELNATRTGNAADE